MIDSRSLDKDMALHVQPNNSSAMKHSEVPLSLTPQQLDDLASWADYTNFNENEFDEQVAYVQQQPNQQPNQQGQPGDFDFYSFKHRGSISEQPHTDFTHEAHFQSPFVDMPHYDAYYGGSKSATVQAVKPEVIFTPLISPAVVPMDRQHQQHQHAQNTGFSPLTSPALEFQSSRSPVLRTKRTPGSGSPSGSPDDGVAKSKKSKTPASTPIVGPSVSGRLAKQSPVIKARRGGYTPGAKRHSTSSYHNSSRSSSVISMSVPDTDMVVLPDAELMLPPPVPKKERTTTSPEEDADNVRPATPAMLMSFTMQKLQQSQQQQQSSQQQQQPSQQTSQPLQRSGSVSRDDNVFANPRRQSSCQSSPVILPSSSSMITLTNVNSHEMLKQEDDEAGGSGSGGDGKMPDKKINHKLAEQGRRNRMNVAIQNLDSLLPDVLKKEVVVPSKATTVELASRYIAHLHEQIALLRGKDGDSSTSSISPMEYKEESR